MIKQVLALLLLAGVEFAADVPCNSKQQDETTGALIMVEMRWVEALNNKDTKLLGCLLAPEFADAGVDGQLRDRKTVLAELPGHPSVKQHLRELKAAVAGDTGVVRGINHVVLPHREAADIRFTNTFAYLNGVWQAVAAQETLIREGETKTVGKDQHLDFEITPEELKKKLDAGEKIVVLDVREPWELQTAHVVNTKNIAMGDVPAKAHQDLDPEEHIVVMCHHGVRSANVTAWLQQQGFEKVQSLQGGIDRWARTVDTKVATY
jgi:rhodanese-related sulfurtransferase